MQIRFCFQKKMSNVYVWEYVKGSVGHCSLLLDNGIYISWWPKENKLKFMKMNKKVRSFIYKRVVLYRFFSVQKVLHKYP